MTIRIESARSTTVSSRIAPFDRLEIRGSIASKRFARRYCLKINDMVTQVKYRLLIDKNIKD